jgi:hypothetical protein
MIHLHIPVLVRITQQCQCPHHEASHIHCKTRTTWTHHSTDPSQLYTTSQPLSIRRTKRQHHHKKSAARVGHTIVSIFTQATHCHSWTLLSYFCPVTVHRLDPPPQQNLYYTYQDITVVLCIQLPPAVELVCFHYPWMDTVQYMCVRVCSQHLTWRLQIEDSVYNILCSR